MNHSFTETQSATQQDMSTSSEDRELSKNLAISSHWATLCNMQLQMLCMTPCNHVRHEQLTLQITHPTHVVTATAKTDSHWRNGQAHGDDLHKAYYICRF
jgi:hypothetical protein